MNEEGILVALKLGVTDATRAQLRGILSKCDFEPNELEKIVLLNDKLQSFGAFIAMSNSYDYFKIKNESPTVAGKKAVMDIVFEWSDKYRLKLEKVPNKDTYYIIGRF